MIGGSYFGIPLVMLIFSSLMFSSMILITGRRLRIKCFSLFSIDVGSQFENYWQPAVSNETREIQDGTNNVSGTANNNRSISDAPSTTNSTTQNVSCTNNCSNASHNRCNDTVNQNSINQAPKCATSMCTTVAAPSCCVVSQPTRCLRHSVVHRCMTSPPYSEEGLAGSSFDQYPVNFQSVRQQQPLRDVTSRWTNQNMSHLAKQWTDENRSEVEEVIFRRRRKMSC